MDKPQAECQICNPRPYPRWLQTNTTLGDIILRLMLVILTLGAVYLLLLMAWTFPIFGIAAGFILATSIVLELVRR